MSEPIIRKTSQYHPDVKQHTEENARVINIICDLMNQGIILESPNGTRYRLEVDNAGVLSTTSL